jgi:hypothetical protein
MTSTNIKLFILKLFAMAYVLRFMLYKGLASNVGAVNLRLKIYFSAGPSF